MPAATKRKIHKRHPPMRLLPMETIWAALDNGPEWWRVRDIEKLFGMAWDYLRRTPGLVVPRGVRGRGYSRDMVWMIAQQRQAVALRTMPKPAMAAVKRENEHEWCDPAIIRTMLDRWADDHTTIQELHDRAGVRPIATVPRRYTPRSIGVPLDDT